MSVTTLTSREFNQDTSRAKKAAAKGPVFITTRGQPAHVLMTIEEYRRITGDTRKVADLLAWPGAADVDLPLDRSAQKPRAVPFA
jgi:prevent-host-death family protein